MHPNSEQIKGILAFLGSKTFAKSDATNEYETFQPKFEDAKKRIDTKWLHKTRASVCYFLQVVFYSLILY